MFLKQSPPQRCNVTYVFFYYMFKTKNTADSVRGKKNVFLLYVHKIKFNGPSPLQKREMCSYFFIFKIKFNGPSP